MKAIIFAAGDGTKIWPYNIRNKTSIKFLNKPIIQWNIEYLLENNFDEKNISIVIKKNDKNLNFLNKEFKLDFLETEKDGVLDTLIELFSEKNLDNTLIIYGDSVIDKQAFKEIAEMTRNNMTSLVVNEFSEENHIHFGASIADENISEIFGHPRDHYVTHKLSGYFSINNKFKKYWKISNGYLDNVPVGGMVPNENFLEIAINMSLKNGDEWKPVHAKEFAFDLERPSNILDASIYFAEKFIGSNKQQIMIGTSSKIDRNVTLNGNIMIGDNSHIKNGAIIGKNVFIGNNVIIEDYAIVRDNSVISDDCHIGHTADIEGIMFDGSKALHNSEFYGIIGRRTDIAAGVSTGSMRFDDSFSFMDIKGYKFKGTNTNCTYVGESVRTGVNCSTYPGVIIGNFALIGPGVVVKKNVQDYELIEVEQNLTRKNWKLSRYGW